MTKTGLFNFLAVLAVFRAPLFSGASTTIKAFEMEAISLFLFKNEKGCGGVSGKYSLIIAPPDVKIWFKSVKFFEVIKLKPEAIIAIVLPEWIAPWCEAESIPDARPLTIIVLLNAKSFEIW